MHTKKTGQKRLKIIVAVYVALSYGQGLERLVQERMRPNITESFVDFDINDSFLL